MCLRKEIRWEQSVTELSRLDEEFQAWDKDVAQFDKSMQYRTQLEAIRKLMNGALTAVHTSLSNVVRGDGVSIGDVFEECRTYDLRVLWLRRIWRFFADKFDQRRDCKIGPFLRAADEVVWSCFRHVFENAKTAGVAIEPTAAPMPFVEPWLSPVAFPPQAHFIPAELLEEIDQYFQARFLAELPVAVLRLPLAYVGAPWWLVLIAHEVGHHLQFQLQRDQKLVTGYKELVEQTVKQTQPGAVKEWVAWSSELFADAVSVLLLGPTAIKAIVQLEHVSESSMLARRDTYPPAAVRLAFLFEVAKLQGLEVQAKSALAGIDPAKLVEPDQIARRDHELVAAVAAASLQPFADLPVGLGTLCGFNPEFFIDMGDVTRWNRLLQGGGAHTEETLEAARLAAAGAWEAQEVIVRDAGEPPAVEEDRLVWSGKRVARLDVLANDAQASIIASRVAGERAAKGGDAALTRDFGKELADALLQAPRQKLEQAGVPHAR